MEENKKGYSVFLSQYSITTIHVIVEILCLFVIFLYIRRNINRLQNQINDLSVILQEHQKTLHTHHQLLTESNNNPNFDSITTLFKMPLNTTTTPSTLIPNNKIEELDVVDNHGEEIIVENDEINIPVSKEEKKKEEEEPEENLEEELKDEIQELKEEENKNKNDNRNNNNRKKRH